MGMKAKVLPFGMNDQMLSRRIAEIAKDSSKVIILPHAKQRMCRRKINRRQVDQVLLHGKVVEHAHRDIYGNWKCTLEAVIAGDRIKVPAVLNETPTGDFVIVITVMN